MHLDIVCVVWGHQYTQLLLDFCMPSLLAPGNLPAWSYCAGTTLQLYTTASDQKTIIAHPATQALQRYIALSVHLLPEASGMLANNKYKRMSQAHQLALDVAQRSGHAFMFMTPDHLFSDGSFQVIESAYQSGYEGLVTASLRIDLHSVQSELKVLNQGHQIVLSPEACLDLLMRHIHTTTQDLFWDGDFNHTWPSHLYFWKNPHTLAMRCFHVHPLFFSQVTSAFDPDGGTLDGNYLNEAFRNKEKIKFIADQSLVLLSLTDKLPSSLSPSTKPLTVSERLWIVDDFRRHHTQPIHRTFFQQTVEWTFAQPCGKTANADTLNALEALVHFWQIEEAYLAKQYTMGDALFEQHQTQSHYFLTLFLNAMAKHYQSDNFGKKEDILSFCKYICLKLCEYFPEDVYLLNNLGAFYLEAGQLDQAEVCFKKAYHFHPTSPDFANNLALLAIKRNDFQTALVYIWTALPPPYPPYYPRTPALYHLSVIIAHMGDDPTLQVKLTQELFESKHRQGLYRRLIEFYAHTGQIENYFYHFERYLQSHPHDSQAYSSWLLHLLLKEDITPLQSRACFEQWQEKFTTPAHTPMLFRPSKPNKVLRIGYVSGNFCYHSAMQSFGPLFAYHDHLAFEIYVYDNTSLFDESTMWLKSRTDCWRSIQAMSDEKVCELIYEQDQIDILVDLSGHTFGNRLLLFAHKPAPIQITGLGFGATTGLSTMDYRFTDPYILPPELVESGTEAPLYLTSLLCWLPTKTDGDHHAITTPPCAITSRITFGCLNSSMKLTSGTIALWSQILHQLPESRLLLGSSGLEQTAFRQILIQHFEKHGIDPMRLLFTGHAPHQAFIQNYARIDIALDPFPYNGGITTCEALWMGVPVITLKAMTGNRSGYSLLSQIGAQEWIADTKEEYIRIALDLATNHHQLSELRFRLRERFRRSPICQAEAYTREIEQAYQNVWQKACR